MLYHGHELNYSLNYYFAQLDHTVEPLNDVGPIIDHMPIACMRNEKAKEHFCRRLAKISFSFNLVVWQLYMANKIILCEKPKLYMYICIAFQSCFDCLVSASFIFASV